MHQLILIDKASGLEVGRRDMDPQERYVLGNALQYALLHREHVLFTHESKQYTMHTLAWRLPEEDCVVSVTYHARERMSCGCESGYCTCC
jgi:hypothetical protein